MFGFEKCRDVYGNPCGRREKYHLNMAAEITGLSLEDAVLP